MAGLGQDGQAPRAPPSAHPGRVALDGLGWFAKRTMCLEVADPAVMFHSIRGLGSFGAWGPTSAHHARRAMVMISGLAELRGLLSQSPNRDSTVRRARASAVSSAAVSRNRKVLWLTRGCSQASLWKV